MLPTPSLTLSKRRMKILSNTERHSEVLALLHEIYIQKNKRYGNSANRTFKKFGALSYAIRLSDKMERFTELVKDPSLDNRDTDESIIDTLLDLANYAIMAVMDLTEKDDAER